MLGILVGLLCALSWAVSSVMMKDLARKLDPMTLNAPRALVGGLALLATVFATGRQAGYGAITPLQLFFMLGSMAVGGGIGDAMQVMSLARIGVARSYPISAIYPALTLVFGVLFLHEAVSLGMVAGLALVMAGVYLISRVPGAVSEPERRITASGVGFALGAAICWAAAMLMIAPGIEGHDPILVASIRVPVLALALWGIVIARGSWRDLGKLSPREWVILLVGGLIGWGLGGVLFVLTVEMVGPTQTAILTSTSPMFALPLSALLLRERLPLRVLVGTVLTICGVILVS